MMLAKKWSQIKEYRYLMALVITFNFLLTPIHIILSEITPAYVIVVNYTLVVLSNGLIASEKKARFTVYAIGFLTLVSIWLELSNATSELILISRLLFSFLLFSCFCIVLLKQLLKIKKVNLRFILGPLLGFLYLGIIGGILFEAIHLLDRNSFRLIDGFS